MPTKKEPLYEKLMARLNYLALLFVFISICLIALFFIKTKEVAFDLALEQYSITPTQSDQIELPEAFPVGVDPLRELVVENPNVDSFLEVHYSFNTDSKKEDGWFIKLLATLTRESWYQNLASPISRILVVDSGERKEEVAQNFASILKWDASEKKLFIDLVTASAPSLSEGKFFPGSYVLNKDATPQEAAQVLVAAFNAQILSRYPEEIDTLVPIEDALTIASLLEREAYDFEDMRYISGVIWNRLFIDMDLQLDATLQYAKANQGGNAWWPVPRPADKFIESPYNTYQNEGLPPSPIANPSVAAVVAALNPKKTDCLFYFHDSEGDFYCSKTYEEHVAALKKIYGQGR